MQGIDLKEWELFISNGAWLVGRVRTEGNDGVEVGPVYELHHSLLPLPVEGGGVQHVIPLKLTPFLGLGISSLRIPKGAIRKPLEAFNEARGWILQIEAAVQQENQIRAARMGVVLPHH